jgi:hypothetical protein
MSELTIKEQLNHQILYVLSKMKMASTKQIELLFSGYGSPGKRASEWLNALSVEGLIEGKRVMIGQYKLWRLTKKGRLLMEVPYATPMRFTNPKITHQLEIGELFIRLLQTKRLKRFELELREPFISIRTKKLMLYCPDAFFQFHNRLFVMELQRTRITRKAWQLKWDIAEEFFEDEHYQNVTWHPFDKTKHLPEILVISTQNEQVIKADSRLKIHHLRKIEDMNHLLI